MATAGNKNVVYFLKGQTPMDGTTGVKLEGLDNASLSQTADMLEITEFGSEYKKRIPGLKDTSVSISGNYKEQQHDEIEAGDYVMIGMYPNGTENQGKQVLCIVESVEYSADASDKQTISMSLQGAGEPVEVLPARE
jgi:predicted secreted protein